MQRKNSKKKIREKDEEILKSLEGVLIIVTGNPIFLGEKKHA